MLKRRQVLRHLAAAAATVAAPVFAQAERKIVLGQSCALSGPAAQLGIQMRAGAKLFLDLANVQGGINGQTIELRTLDDGYEPDRCKANTERFIKDEVFALLGYVGTPTSLAALPLVNEHKMPFVGPFTGAEALRDPFSKYVFHVRASYYDETELIVHQLTSLGLKKIAVFRQNDSYGKAGLDGVVRALAKRQLEPVAVGLVERNTVDVAKAVEAIAPLRPDAVVQISAYKSCAAFIREARKAGYGGTFYNVSFVGTQALADELGGDAAGVMVSQVMPFPYAMTHPLAREFLATAKRIGSDTAMNYSSIEGYVAAKVLVEGLRRAGRAATQDTLIAGLESLQSFDAGGFSVSYGARDHIASRYVDLTMLTGDGRVRR
jgi:ABC-type branched-subunit amino acid transport system substrate-binding protein